MNRCKWCDLKNPKYVEYHDKEWGVLRTDDSYLFEMLVLESFQAGLSWECILNKRENFRRAYDEFDLDKVCGYDEEKIAELCSDSSIVRNKLKIRASISNARIFRDIVKEQGSFYDYLCRFTDGEILYECDKTTNEWSDRISADLKKRGMKFVGSVIIYSFLQAVGVIYSHDRECGLYREKESKDISKAVSEWKLCTAFSYSHKQCKKPPCTIYTERLHFSFFIPKDKYFCGFRLSFRLYPLPAA